MLESEFQARVIADLAVLFPGCMVLKNDANYIQGFPDLLVLFNERWAALEVKAGAKAPYRPNQKYYLGVLNEMSFAATIYPENAEEVYDALQHALRLGREARISKR